MSDRVVGDGFILVGDAACFVDPLFSSGVHLALSAGVLAAAYVTTALNDPELAVAAGPVYSEMYCSHYNRFHEMAKLFYSSNRTVESYFWEARRILGSDERFVLAPPGLHPGRGRPTAHGLRTRRAGPGELPEELVSEHRAGRGGTGVAAVPDLAPRRRPAGRLVPRLAADAVIVRKPVLGDDRFVWGDVLMSGYPARGRGLQPTRRRPAAQHRRRRTVDAG